MYFHHCRGISFSSSSRSPNVSSSSQDEDGASGRAHGAIRGGTNINNVPLSWPDSFFCLVAEERSILDENNVGFVN